MIYMDNAATTLRKPVQVKEAVLAALDTMGERRARGVGSGPGCIACHIRDTGEAGRIVPCGIAFQDRVYGKLYGKPEYRY